ncbi:MAG: YbaK/EbsC family protein [Candidatus Promineofilum sp.]|nr:YbaK/EbsC family protein [Promineifilum sp.]
MGAELPASEPPASEPLTPVGRALAALGVPLREFRHPGPVTSLEQAAEERGQRPSQVVRSILFRLAAEEYAMVLVAGPQQVDWKALRRHMGQSRLTTASADEVRAVTGYEIGAVSPFGLPRPVRVLLDASVLGEAEVSLGSGERGTTVILSTADLLRALGDFEQVCVT